MASARGRSSRIDEEQPHRLHRELWFHLRREQSRHDRLLSACAHRAFPARRRAQTGSDLRQLSDPDRQRNCLEQRSRAGAGGMRPLGRFPGPGADFGWRSIPSPCRRDGGRERGQLPALSVIARRGSKTVPVAAALVVAALSVWMTGARAAETLKVGVLKLASSGPVFIAAEQGFYKDQGID